MSELVAAKVGRVGHIRLNRPKALNALTLEMIREMHGALEEWQDDDAVEAVVVTGEGDRAFCAGGDVKSVYFAGKEGEVGRAGTLTADFFREEYTLNHFVATYPKPYVALLDGITMGGGAGISVMGSHRVSSEHLRFAMPETGIGLFPDVGGSYFMSRLGPIGTLLSLTGEIVDFASTLQLGLATHFVPRDSGTELIERVGRDGVDSALAALSHTPPETDAVGPLRALADRCFTAESLEGILESLDQLAAEADTELSSLASDTRERLNGRSPTSMKVTLEQLRRGKNMSFRDCLIMEYRLSQACMQGHDFYEGIRAVLVDKDHAPKWSPASVEEVTPELVEKHFEHLGERELDLAVDS